MSKATIHSSIRLGGTVYTPGMEDELAKVLDNDQVARLTDVKAISGFGAKSDKDADHKASENTEESEEPTKVSGKTKTK